MELIELGPAGRPPGAASIALSLERTRPIPRSSPQGRDAHDLYFFDSFAEHPGRGLTPERMFASFRLAELGYPQRQVDLFDDLVERDGHTRNLFEHREGVIANKPLVLNPGGTPNDVSQLAARVLGFALGRLALKDAFKHLLRVNRYGYSAVEIEWGVIDFEGRPWVVPVDLILVPARRFRIGTIGMAPDVRIDELRLYAELERPMGDDLRPGKWLVVKRQPAQLARAGLMRTAAPLILAKGLSFRDLIVLSQRYGIPMPIAEYDETADDLAKDVAAEIVRNLGTDGGAVVPKDKIKLEIVKGVDAKSPIQYPLLAYCNAELSKLVNGSTLRNDSASTSGASYAMANVHNQVAWDEVKGDGDLLAEAITLQIGGPFVRYNNLACEAPRASIIVEPDLDSDGFMSIAVKARNELGIPVSKSQVMERCGLRAPMGPDDEAPGMQVDKFPTGAGGPP